MKRLPMVISFVVALVAMVAGCGRAPRYDGRLTAADSLMRSDPDSALAIVEAVNPDSLTCEGDRAYRDLLLTQARYRCYITATTDSDINRALAYYQRHSGECEKLTRAYIYKGAVMEELGHPDSAMLYYKQAEATAAPDDYFNLGYAKMRIGSLYNGNFAYDGAAIKKYEEALAMFSKSGDLEYQYKCLNNLGCQYRDSDPQKAEQLLRKAMSISKQNKDTANLVEDIHALIVLFYYNKQYDKALTLLQEAERLNRNEFSFDFLTSAANLLAKAGRPDSAMVYLNLAAKYDIEEGSKRKMYYLESLGEIALARGDTLTYLDYNHQENKIANSLMSNESKIDITKAELNFDRDWKNALSHKHATFNWLIILGICLATLIAVFFLVKYFRQLKQLQLTAKELYRNRKIITELKQDASNQLTKLDKLQNNFDRLQIKELQIREFITSQLDVLREITVACYHNPKNKVGEQVKSIVQFREENMDKWSNLYVYIDAEYNDIMSNTKKNYPMLNERDLLVIALSCMDFSYVQIAMILGYTNATSIGTIKQRIANKMNLNCSLNDYIKNSTQVD